MWNSIVSVPDNCLFSEAASAKSENDAVTTADIKQASIKLDLSQW